jgi:hypothetical protein
MRVGFELESPKACKSKAYKGLKPDYFSTSVISDFQGTHPSCMGSNFDYSFLFLNVFIYSLYNPISALPLLPANYSLKKTIYLIWFLLKKKHIFIFSVCVCVCVCVCVIAMYHGCQRTAQAEWLSPARRVPEIKLRSLGLMASTFTHRASLSALMVVL